MAIVFLASVVPARAQCPAPSSGTILNPSEVLFESPEHLIDEADGGPRISDYQVGYFLPTTGTIPAATVPVVGPWTVAKSSVTLVSGTTNCYRAPTAAFISTLAGPLVAAVKPRRATRPTLAGGEADYRVSNPFAVAPAAPATLGAVVVR